MTLIEIVNLWKAGVLTTKQANARIKELSKERSKYDRRSR